MQSLTIQANIIDGRVVYEDSPLIKAIKEGSVAVIDEADKAPTNVTGILKSLIESGSMFLSDGRRVFPKETGNISTIPSKMIIRTHPNFRMIVLANRPGFPFLGNDFFLSVGDHFSTFPIVNPPRESEIILLQNFGPKIERKQLEQLVDVFTELRQLAIDGIISYPYSLRELVSIVKHLNMFPQDSLADVVRNVFDLDNYSTDMLERLRTILHRHGIPFHVKERTVQLASSHPLKLVPQREIWPLEPLDGVSVEYSGAITLGEKSRPATIRTVNSIHRNDSRTERFSELVLQYRLPLDDTTYVHDFNVLKAKNLVLVLTGNPLSLWTFTLGENQARKFDLSPVFQTTTNRFTTPNYKLCVLPEKTDQVLIGDLNNQTWATVDLEDGRSALIQSNSASSAPFTQTITRKFNEMLSQRTPNTTRSAYNPTNGQLLQYAPNQDTIGVLDFVKNTFHQIKLPVQIRHTVPFGDQWLLVDQGSSSYLLNASDARNPTLSRLQYNLDAIGLASSGGSFADNSLWFSSAHDYLVKMSSKTEDGLVVERFKRAKTISAGDVPLQEMHEKRRLQTFAIKPDSLLASFYAKNEVDPKLL